MRLGLTLADVGFFSARLITASKRMSLSVTSGRVPLPLAVTPRKPNVAVSVTVGTTIWNVPVSDVFSRKNCVARARRVSPGPEP